MEVEEEKWDGGQRVVAEDNQSVLSTCDNETHFL